MRGTRVVAAMAFGLAVLAGCGGGARSSGLDLPEYGGSSDSDVTAGRSPSELLAGARAAVAQAESVSLSGTTGSGDETFSVDLAFKGPDGSGSYSIGAGTLTVLLADGRALYRGDSQVYAQMYATDPAAFERRLAGRWILAGSTDPRLTVPDVISTRDDFLADVVDPGPGELTATREDVDGVAAIALTNDSGTMYVDPESLRPLRIVLAGDSGDGITFTYGPVDQPVAPPADQIVDLADL